VSGALPPQIALLPLVAARDAARKGAGRLVPVRAWERPDALRAAIDWLCLSHEVTGRRGSSKAYSLVLGWEPAYPETTGYVIGTLLAYARRRGDARCIEHARAMGDWEIAIQSDDGGIMGGVVKSPPGPSIAFNTGMVLHGWLDLHEALGDERHLDAARRAGDFLVRVQDADGAWRGTHAHHGIAHAYKARVAWALLRLASATSDGRFRAAATRNLDWVLSRQRENGWFESCEFKPGTLPNTHGIAYTLRGLLESHALAAEDAYLEAALKTAEVLMRKLEVLDGLPATFDSEWRARARYVCVTGVVQLGGVWLRLYELTGDARLLNAGLKAVDQAASLQQRGRFKPLDGPIPGSFPIWGAYAPLQYPNWATKFLADALMIRDRCLAA